MKNPYQSTPPSGINISVLPGGANEDSSVRKQIRTLDNAREPEHSNTHSALRPFQVNTEDEESIKNRNQPEASLKFIETTSSQVSGL